MTDAILRNISFIVSDNAGLPIANGRVDFYRQGSTVRVQVSATDTVIQVYDVGDAVGGSTLKIGVGGASLTVQSINKAAGTITLTAGAPSTIPVGTRLLLTSNRPTLYKDPFGTVAANNYLLADGAGRIAGYINLRRFDYVVPGAGIDNSSTATVAGANSLTWSHTLSGDDRHLLVCMSWEGAVGDEVINSVTCGGQAMTLVASTSYCSMYKLVNPPAGQQTIVASFSGLVHGVGAAISSLGVHQTTPLGSAQTASALPSALASITVSGTVAGGIVVNHLGVGDIQGATATKGPNQTERWNLTGGSGSYITRGAGSTGAGGGGSVTAAWTLSASRNWGMIGVELKPIGRIISDAEGSTFARSPWGVNVQDYQSIQDAVNAIGTEGGLVYVPEGTYNATTRPSFVPPLVLPPDRQVRLLGAGPRQSKLESIAVNTDMIQLTGNSQTIENIWLQGPGAAGSGVGIRIWRTANPPGDDYGNPNVIVRAHVLNCRIHQTASWALRIDDAARSSQTQFVVWAMLEGLDIEENRSNGALYLGTAPSAAVFLQNCRIAHFRGYGVSANVPHLSMIDCIVEASLTDGSASTAKPYVYMDGCSSANLDHVYFEGSVAIDTPYTDEQGEFIVAKGRYRGLVINGCRFSRNAGYYLKAIRIAGYGQSVMIINPDVVVPYWPDTTPTSLSHIIINARDTGITGSADNEVTIVNGATYYNDGSVYRPLLINDNSSRTTLINSGLRVRLPRLTTTERDALVNVLAGDAIFNKTVNVGQWWDGSVWRWTGVPRMTTTQRDALSGVVAGDAIYNTNGNVIQYWNGSIWKQITATDA